MNTTPGLAAIEDDLVLGRASLAASFLLTCPNNLYNRTKLGWRGAAIAGGKNTRDHLFQSCD
jgi:hypothetical protein